MNPICAYCKRTSTCFFKLNQCANDIRSEFRNLKDEEQICKKCHKKAIYLLKIKCGEKPIRKKREKVSDKDFKSGNKKFETISLSNLKTENKDWLKQASVNVLSPSFKIEQTNFNTINKLKNDSKSTPVTQNVTPPFVANTDRNSKNNIWQEPFPRFQNYFQYRIDHTSESQMLEEQDITIGFKTTSESKRDKVFEDVCNNDFMSPSSSAVFAVKKPFLQKSNYMSPLKNELYYQNKNEFNQYRNTSDIENALNSTSSFDLFDYSSDEDIKCGDIFFENSRKLKVCSSNTKADISTSEKMKTLSDDLFTNPAKELPLIQEDSLCPQFYKAFQALSCKDYDSNAANVSIDIFSTSIIEEAEEEKHLEKLHSADDPSSIKDHVVTCQSNKLVIKCSPSSYLEEDADCKSPDLIFDTEEVHEANIMKKTQYLKPYRKKSVKFAEPLESSVKVYETSNTDIIVTYVNEMEAMLHGPDFKGKNRKIALLRNKITKIMVKRKALQLKLRSKEPFTVPTGGNICGEIRTRDATMKELTSCRVVLERLPLDVKRKYL